MDRVFEHEVDEVWVGLYKLVEHLQILKISPLLLIEDVEIVFVRIEFHVLILIHQVGLGLSDLFVTFLKFLFFLLK